MPFAATWTKLEIVILSEVSQAEKQKYHMISLMCRIFHHQSHPWLGYVIAMVFPVVMYRCENWTIEKAECWRTDAFELWCWIRLLRVHWTAISNQSILKEISPEYSLEGLMLKLKLQYFATWWRELTHWKRPWCWERLKAGGEGDDRGWDGWMASPTRWTWVCTSSRSWWWTGRPGMLQPMELQSWTPWGHKESDVTEQLNWIELICRIWKEMK